MNRPRMLLTGATGLIGGDILKYFHGLKSSIVMATSTRGVVALDESIRTIPFDLLNLRENTELQKSLKQVDVVVHCAAVMPTDCRLEDPVQASRVFLANTVGTYDLMDMAARSNVSQFIFMSAISTPRPRNVYVLSKQLGTSIADYMTGHGRTKFCTFNISAPYGIGYKAKAVVPQFVERALSSMPLELWGKGLREQTFTYVRDISRACELAIQKNVAGQFNITGGTTITMRKLAELILDVIPDTGSKIVYTHQADPNEKIKRQISIQAAKKAFGYAPIYDLRKGISEMIDPQRGEDPPLYKIS